MALYGRFMVFHGFVSLFLAVIDPNSFDLVKYKKLTVENTSMK